MSLILVASPMPGAGKTALAAGMAMHLAYAGRPVRVTRIRVDGASDPNATDDARTFGALQFPQEGPRVVSPQEVAALTQGFAGNVILEAPRGADFVSLASDLDAQVLVVLRGQADAWPELASLASALGERLLGTIVVASPAAAADVSRAKLDEAGLRPLGVLPEDRALFAPSIREIAEHLHAEVAYDSGAIDDVMEHIVIALIAADAGRPYFARFPRKAVVVRVDKPDLILAALNGGANCLILTGHGAPMLYIVDRARHEQVTILLSHRGTVDTMRALEDVYDATRFQGELKVERIVDLLERHAYLDRALAADVSA